MAEKGSAFAHALGGLRGAAGANLFLYPIADIGIDIPPVLAGPSEHLATHPTQQAPRNLVDQLPSLVIVDDVAHQDAGLGEVVVVLAERIGARDHLAVRLT